MSNYKRDNQLFNMRYRDFFGSSPRIEPIAEENLADEIRDFARNISKTFGKDSLSGLPTVFLIMAKNPEIARAQFELGARVAGKGTIPLRQQELAVLRTAWLCAAPFVWAQHVDFASRCGITAEEIELTTVGPEAECWTNLERAVLKGVDELINVTMVSDETWAVLAEHWSEPQLIEFPMLVGRYVSAAMAQNSLRIAPTAGPTPAGLSGIKEAS